MNLSSVIEPLGIATYSFLSITILLALFRKKIKTKWFPLHRLSAFITISLATLHLILVLIIY